MRRFCVERLKDHAELEAETESDEETVDGVGIQSAAAPIAAGAAAAQTGTPEGRSDLRTGRRGEDATVAQLNRVIFNHKVPSLSEADTGITIASSSLATLPATAGTVPIESGFTMTVNCPATSVSLGHSYEFEVLDCARAGRRLAMSARDVRLCQVRQCVAILVGQQRCRQDTGMTVVITWMWAKSMQLMAIKP